MIHGGSEVCKQQIDTKMLITETDVKLFNENIAMDVVPTSK